ncbi:unnamed protein product [Heterobilharzia americana]|nr:unnamed protein product [Heterobilharzia americana]
MEVVYHELSAGKDTSLSQILSEWSRRYEEKYAVLQRRFSGFNNASNCQSMDISRPKSADFTQPSYNELLEEIEGALQLKANLSVELEALQQIRAELEDSECMSEVHFRLERATDNNRRLHTALQAADEQITELVLSKRLLEAQMSELRSSRDAELAEAKERVRAAERAVIAATRSVNSRKSVSNELLCLSEPATNQQNLTSDSTRPPMSLTYKRPLQNHPKSFTTLTAFSYDDFDSLEEDTDDDTEKPSCEINSTANSGENNLELLMKTEKLDTEMAKSTPTVGSSNADNQPNQEHAMESSLEDHVSSKDMEAITSLSSPSLDVLNSVSPALSSTPRKSLPNETDVTAFSGITASDFTNDVIGCYSDLKATPFTKQQEEVVSKVDYLRLLDEMEELRQEVELLRQNAQLNGSISKPVITDREHLTTDKRHYNPGLTTQLLELKDEVASTTEDHSSQQRSSLLLPCAPGSTRLYDWSLNRSDLQMETHMDISKSGESQNSTDENTPIKTSSSPCNHCVELQAKILTYEALCAAHEDFLKEKSIQQVFSNTKTDSQCTETLQKVDVATETQEFVRVLNDTMCTQTDSEMKNVLPSVCSQTDLDMTLIDSQLKNCTTGLEFYHRMILSIIDVSAKLKHELNAHIVNRCSQANSDLSLDDDNKTNCRKDEGKKSDELNVQFLNDFLNDCNHLLATGVISDSKFIDDLQTDCKSLTSAVEQLLPEIDRLLTQCKVGREQLVASRSISQVNQTCEVSLTNVEKDIENSELVRTLRAQLFTAQQLLTEKLPVDTKNALLETTQIVETERIQLQAEMNRRMLEFERNHTASLVELETNRHDLLKQLDELEVTNRELKNELSSMQQKLQAKERFLNEQTEERELEREEFRIELNRLKSELEMKNSQLMSYKLMDPGDTDSCATPRSMKEVVQNNCIPNWISDLKLEGLIQNDSVKTNVQAFMNSKSCEARCNMPHDSDDDISSGNVNNSSQDKYKYVDSQNKWYNYAIPSMIDNSSFLDSQRNTPDNYSVQSYPDKVGIKQPKLIDDSNVYIQHVLKSCDACTQVEFIESDESVGTFRFIDAEVQCTDEFTMNPELKNSYEALSLPQPTPDNGCCANDDTATTDPYDTFNVGQPTRTTKTTRIRTLNTTSAAALVSHVVVTEEEEESVVTVVDEPGLSDATPETNQQKFLQDQLDKYREEVDQLRKQLHQNEMEQNKSDVHSKRDRDTQTTVLSHEICPHEVKIKDSFTPHETSSFQKKHHRSLPTLFSPSSSSNPEDTGVEMSQDLVDLESIEFTTPPTTKSPVVQDLVSVKSVRSSSPEDENLQTLIGSPISDKDDDMEKEIPEIMLLSDRLSVSPSPSPEHNVCDEPLECIDLVQPILLDLNSGEAEDTSAMVPLSEVSKLIEQLTDSEVLIKALRNEISDLTKYQVELEKDYNTVHEMLVERQNDLTRVTEQLLQTEDKCKCLSNQLLERKDVISERDEDLFLLNEDKKSLELRITELESEIKELRCQVKSIESDNHFSSVSSQTEFPAFQPLFDSKAVQTTVITNSLTQSMSGYDQSKIVNTNNNCDQKELNPVQTGTLQLWATSTPKEEDSPNSTFLSTEDDIPGNISAELNTLTNRLREESVRLATATAIATARQSVCERTAGVIVNNPVCIEDVIKVEAEAYSPWINEIQDTYTDLKEAIGEVTKVIHTNPWINKEQSEFDDTEETMRIFVSRLLLSVSKALDSDEKLWLSVLTSSVNQTCDIIQNNSALPPNLMDRFTENILCKIIQHLTERITAFMRREDEFRKCLIEVLHVEKASFNSELKTHIHRSDTLVEEMNRLTQLVSSRSVELDHAYNRTNELQDQLSNLKVELVHTQHELQSKANEADHHQTYIEKLRSQLSEECAQTEKLRRELELLQSAKVQIEHELLSSNNLVQELKTSLSSEKNRAQNLKIEVDQLHDQIKKNTLHTTLSYANGYNSNCVGGVTSKSAANENKVPIDYSSNPNRNLYQAINLATVHLASTRRDAIKLQNQVKELQSTAQGLRLNLAEAELRLMPTLTSFVPDALNHSNTGPNSHCCIVRQYVPKEKSLVSANQSELPSSRFAKLKNVCTDLLSRVSMDERDVQDDDYDENDANSHSSDDDSIEENIFIGSGITNPLVGNRVIAEHDNSLSPSGRESKSSTHVTSQNYATVSHGSTDRKSKRRIHSNNLCRSTSDKYSKIADLSTSTASYSNRMSSPIQTLPVMTTSMMSSSGVTTDQTVSVEQYRALYARCLRVESYRRALSFQKRYLLLLLGNFQYSEDVVVANLGCPESRIAPQVDSEDGFPSRLNSSPLQRFRIIGRVVQVVHRMRYLVNKWRRVGVISIPSMQSTPFSYTESHANTVPPNSYYVPPFQHRSFNFQSARAITTNRNPNSSLRTPLRELHTDESNNTSLSVVKNSSNFNGKPLLLNNSNYIPRVSQVQTSPSCYNSLREDQTVSKAVSHRWYVFRSS